MNMLTKHSERFGSGLLCAHIDGFLGATIGSAYWKDKAGKYLSANEHFIRQAGFTSQQELQGMSHQDQVWNEVASTMIVNDNKVVNQQQTSLFIEHCKIIDPHNSSHLINVDCISYKSPLLNRLGKIIGVFGLSYTINTALDQVQLFKELNLIAGEEAATKIKKLLAPKHPGISQLSHRELTCFKGVIQGMTIKQIAKSLSLSPRTIEQYVEGVKNKLGCHSRSELVEKAFELGLITRNWGEIN